MHAVWLSLPIVVPVLFWSAYHWHKDRHLPEPIGNLALCFVLGCGSAAISRLIYEGLDLLHLRFDAVELGLTDLPGLLAYSLLAIGPIEELAKLIPFLIVALRFRAFDEPLDGVIYASFIALGFATMENLHYLQYLTTFEAIARGFASPLVHVTFASVWGYYIGRSFLQYESGPGTAVIAVVAATTLHGTYDFLVLAEPLSALPLAAVLVVSVWIWRMLLIRGIHSRNGHEGKCSVCERVAGDQATK